jgi:4-amino-4-deoxy-L-arabinose transferase-like glycosyltransferase
MTAANAPTSHWSFLYTLYLTATYTIFGPHPLAARLLQAVLVGILQPLLAFLLGRRLFNEITGLVSAFLTAIYAYFIYYAATLMTEPFYITAILAATYLIITLTDRIAKGRSTRREIMLHAAGLGVIFGAIVLLRQVFLMITPFFFLWMWWVLRKKNFITAFAVTAVSAVVVILMILPFTYYNYARFGRFVMLNTNAGYAFYLANHPIYGTKFIPILPPEMGTYQDLIPQDLRGLDEAALDQALLKQGMQFIVDDPLRYIQLSISRVPALFMFWPSKDSETISNISRVASFGLFLPFMIYGLAVALFSKTPQINLSSPVLLPIAFSVLYATIHLLSWSLVRYRLPIDAVMLIFAGLALVDLFKRARQWIGHQGPAGQAVKQV